MLIGKGSTLGCLDDNDILATVIEALQQVDAGNKRVLVIIPGAPRGALVPAFFRTFFAVLCDPKAVPLPAKAAALDYLIAAGTRRPLSEEQINSLLGVSAEDRAGRYGGVRIFNHRWDDPDGLSTAGTIPAAEIAGLTGGLLAQDLPVTVNRLIFSYDLLVVCGPAFPDDVAGFSGGNQYFFPGISGPEVINFTAWLATLSASDGGIGTRSTPARAVIDRAAAMIDHPRLGFSYVLRPRAEGHTAGTGTTMEPGATASSAVTGEGEPAGRCLAGLYAGTPEEAYGAAAGLSVQLHVAWLDRPARRVLLVLPEMYEDIESAAQAASRVEPAVADGGEIVIYAPHVTEVSYTHGLLIDRIGYHCRDYFLKQWDRFAHVPGAVLAHAARLRGEGTYDPATGSEHDRIQVTLATGIAAERCERLNLGYLDPAAVNPEDWAGRAAEGVLLLRPDGEMLYRVKAGSAGSEEGN